MKKPAASKKKAATKKQTAAARANAERPGHYHLVAQYLGDKQYPRGTKLRIGFLPKIPKRVECGGISHSGKGACKFVDIQELGKLRIEPTSRGRSYSGACKARDAIRAQLAKG